jgi:predicted lysophospholipase L1 biosynthesis ABC-type transport system permease subunit
VYFPFPLDTEADVDRMVFGLRTTANPLSYVDTVREIVRAANPRVPITRMATQDALIAQTFSREILLTRLCVAFAVLALVIAVVGLYGTVRYDVSRRRAEIGVRMALGARRGQVVWTVMRDIVMVVAVGAVLGVAASAAASDLVTSLLFGVTGRDPLTLSAAAGVLVIAAVAGAFIPAHAAARVSPTVALRYE